MKLSAIIIVFTLAMVSCEDQLRFDEKNSTAKPLIVRSIDKEKGLPKETQMAQCTITSGDIKASAQATFSKKLEGFCSTKDMIDLRDNLAAIESRLQDELYYLKQMIKELLPRNSYYNQPRGYYQDNYRPSYRPPPPANYQQNHVQQTFYDKPRDSGKHYESSQTTTKPISTTAENILSKSPLKQPEVVSVKLKSLETSKTKTSRTPTTQAPSTTTSDPPPAKNEYTYYWKLENFPNVFMHSKKNEVFSHVFNVKGLFLRIRAILHQFDDQNLTLDIEHLANIENVDKMEIEISDGLVFQEIAEENLFQYSFAIMDQTKPDHDLISPIYWNTETENFLVPNSLHLLANYVKNDAILIKLNIIF